MKWKLLLVSLLLPLLSSCTGLSLFGGRQPVQPEPIVVTETEYLYREIPIQARPKPVTLYDIEFYAVTGENIDEFLERFTDDIKERYPDRKDVVGGVKFLLKGAN